VITSGGVSVGEADHTKAVMASSATSCSGGSRCARAADGDRRSPSAAATPPSCSACRNPVAVMVTFYAFVRDALLAMAERADAAVPSARGERAPIRKRPAAPNTSAASSSAAATALAGAHSRVAGSGILRSMSEANGLVVLGHSQGDGRRGRGRSRSAVRGLAVGAGVDLHSPYPQVANPRSGVQRVRLRSIAERRTGPPSSTARPVERSRHGEIHRAARNAAAALVRRGLRKGDVFAIVCPNVVEYGIAFHGAAIAGGVVTTANPLATIEELNRQLVDSRARFVVTTRRARQGPRSAAANTAVEELFAIGDGGGATPVRPR
jgi:hypothetical protein